MMQTFHLGQMFHNFNAPLSGAITPCPSTTYIDGRSVGCVRHEGHSGSQHFYLENGRIREIWNIEEDDIWNLED